MSLKTKILYSPVCLKYKSEGHPESPERVKSSWQYLKDKGYQFIEPQVAKESDLRLVHSQDLIEQVKSGKFFDPDTPAIPGIYDYALLSVGGAIGSAELAVKGEKAFSLMRPPGHHAGPNKLGGFCYFNNIAVAVQSLARQGRQVAIIDIDCHHGQGTEEIFLGQKKMMYLSLHQVGIYPNTGYESEQNSYNFPFYSGASPKEYLNTLKQGLEIVRKFQPDIIAVSAGFDTYKNDPLTGMNLELETYEEIGKMISQLKLSVFAVLEGGYSQDLPQCIYGFIKGLESS